jgi:hypothetical protein
LKFSKNNYFGAKFKNYSTKSLTDATVNQVLGRLNSAVHQMEFQIVLFEICRNFGVTSCKTERAVDAGGSRLEQ